MPLCIKLEEFYFRLALRSLLLNRRVKVSSMASISFKLLFHFTISLNIIYIYGTHQKCQRKEGKIFGNDFFGKPGARIKLDGQMYQSL